ncbi:kynureninase/PvdN C-terminal domain-containing protein [Rhodohalobacter halophilus]|uniref:kynureninase/PvdN C-terminal domain-containing protein n=1 Tax=Rhodohalobacter halophilus TaxID=1812810 RepID=UPI00083F8D86|nr:hypothetical protein [Rhodohalobacter halophilus]
MDFDKLAKALQPHYSHFNVANRLLFTGHSHQAWPDVAFDGVREYMQMVADKVDTKWEPAFEKTEVLRNYLRRYYDDPDGRYCREQNTHVLMVSWLSSLNLTNKPKIITTTGEFHSMYRQLSRYKELGMDVVFLPHENDEKLLEKINREADSDTSAIMLSRVYFETSEVNTKLGEIANIAKEREISILIDDYHGTNVVPLSIRQDGLEHCYILIGGYKYLQWGEANCFLRFPSDCNLKPGVTGWFASFETLDEPRDDRAVSFDEGDQKFATGTYDPISQYRAAAVSHFFDRMGLNSETLSNQYSAQVQYLRELFDEKQFDEHLIKHANSRAVDQTGGFLALQAPHARTLRQILLDAGVFTDARGDIIRFGPAPYTTSEQCRSAVDELGKAVQML